MRFFADGPSIPDLLLEGCDQGRVVFLCGAGVSQPCNPGFVELTQHIVECLGPEEDSPIAKALAPYNTKDNDKDSDAPRVPLDQIFHLLYQEYGREEVMGLVAKQLSKPAASKPSHNHSLITRVSSDPEGQPQVVTTNFDRLFETCEGITRDRIFTPPALPYIELGQPSHGITYLHGRLSDLDNPRHDYVLSSEDFGRAYLAEGWATRFVKALLDKFTVVLIGYQAEDPPVKYLLQGLSRDRSREHLNLYAFDKGTFEEIEVKWRDRGAIPIAYNNHYNLWQTMKAWADRVDDHRVWRKKVVGMAKQSPQNLLPYERGQVAHLIRTTPGAKLFAQSEPPPPAEWLCVFDASCRSGEKVGEFDPLSVYGLDDDPERSQGAHYDQLIEWRRGDTNPTARHTLAERQIEGQEDIPNRLDHLLNWSVKHLSDPCFAWWATRRYRKLHPRHVNRIRRKMRATPSLHPKARHTWNLILEAMEDGRRSVWEYESWFNLDDKIKSDGWTSSTLRLFEDTMSPILTYKCSGVKPPEGTWEDVPIANIVKWEVKFPEHHSEPLSDPGESLAEVFLIAENHLRKAAGMHRDTGTRFFETPSCHSEADQIAENGTDAYFRWFVSLLRRMSDEHPKDLRFHVRAWDHKDQFFFRKLKLFVLNDAKVFEANEAAGLVMEFGQDDLWDSQVRRELLFFLVERWPEFTEETKVALTERLLAGPDKIDHWSKEDYPRNKNYVSACYTRCLELRLKHKGYRLSDRQSDQLAKMVSQIPEWDDRWAENVVEESRTQFGRVRQDFNPNILENVAVRDILATARSKSGTARGAFVERQPFIGLVVKNPRKALASLSHASRQKKYPPEEWKQLIENWPKEVTPRLNRVFLLRISRLPDATVRALNNPLASYIETNFKKIYGNGPKLAWSVFDSIVEGLVSDGGSALNSWIHEAPTDEKVIQPSRRTYEHAINSPIGKIAHAWINALNSLKRPQAGGIPLEFRSRLKPLLEAPAEGCDHAVATITTQISWLYYLDPEWVHTEVIPWFDFSHPKAEPAWNGYLHAVSKTFPPPQDIGRQFRPNLQEIFPKINQWGWNQGAANIAAKMVIKLAIFRCKEPDGLSWKEARRCIQAMTDESRRTAIICLTQIGQKKDNSWDEYVIPFIEKAWPKERKFKTTYMVFAWISLLAKTDNSFPQVLKVVRRFLVQVKCEDHWLRPFYPRGSDEKPLTAKYPTEVLDMLDAIILNDSQIVPYELAPILDLIEATDPGLVRNRKYYRLISLVENK